MKTFSVLAAIAVMAFCTGELFAQGCSDCTGGTGYAAPVSYSTPMMTSYASQGCNGCYQTSMAPATCPSNCSTCCTPRRSMVRVRRTNCCDSSCGTYTSSCGGCAQAGCGMTYANSPVSTGCNPCGSSPSYSSATYAAPMQNTSCCGVSNRGCCVNNYAPMAANCGGCGMSYGGGQVYGSGMIMSSGCGDCVGSSVPVQGGVVYGDAAVEGAPIPAAEGTAVETTSGDQNKADTPPTPDDT